MRRRKDCTAKDWQARRAITLDLRVEMVVSQDVDDQGKLISFNRPWPILHLLLYLGSSFQVRAKLQLTIRLL